MLNFVEYIVESANSESDAKGKYHELQVGHYLSGGNLLHHRGKGMGPRDIKRGIKDVTSPERVKAMDKHAKDTASAIHDHLSETHPHHDIHEVHWASQASDHENITGHKDPNSTADLIVAMKHKKTGKISHVGVSLKYGNSKAANLKNPGLNTLSKHAGTDFAPMSAEHNANVKKLGIRSHTHFKTFRDSSDPKKRAVADKVMQSSVNSRQKMAKSYTKDMQKKFKGDEEGIKNHIKGMVAAPTHLPEIRVQTTTHSDGMGAHEPHITSSDHISKALDSYHSIHVANHTGGTSMIIKGTHKKTGKQRVLMQTTFHGGGKPSMPGAVGIVKAPFLTGKDQHD